MTEETLRFRNIVPNNRIFHKCRVNDSGELCPFGRNEGAGLKASPFFPLLGRFAGNGLEATVEGGVRGEARFGSYVVQQHVRMLLHEALGVLDAISRNHRGKTLSRHYHQLQPCLAVLLSVIFSIDEKWLFPRKKQVRPGTVFFRLSLSALDFFSLMTAFNLYQQSTIIINKFV